MTVGTDKKSALLTDRVAAQIRAEMGWQGIRQSQLARLLGENDTWLSMRLRGLVPINLNELQRIAAALNVEAVDLLPRSNQGRVLTTVGQTTDDQERRIKFHQSPLTHPAKPNGHPEREQPHPSLLRPARKRLTAAA